jgi:hypothetical protein
MQECRNAGMQECRNEKRKAFGPSLSAILQFCHPAMALFHIEVFEVVA